MFAALWDKWDCEDHAELTPLLIQLLNRHTFQASRNNKEGGRDFGAPATEQLPWELIFIFRLRGFKGLTNPIIEHRLTEAPFDKLPPPLSRIELGSREKGLMKLIRKTFSNFDDLIADLKTRDWKVIG